MTGRLFGLTWASLAIALIGATCAHAEEKCALTQIASLPIAEAPNGMLTVPLKVGNDTAQFVLAIDQQFGAVTYALINGHELIYHPFATPGRSPAFVTYMGQTAEGKAYVPKITLGQANIANVQALAIQQQLAPGTVGALGLDVLSQFDIELNLQAGKLNLFSPDHCPGEVVYWNRPFTVLPMSQDDQSGTPYFGMQLNGKPVTVKLSVSVNEAEMGSETAKRLFDLSPASPGVTLRPDLTKTVEIRRKRLMDIGDPNAGKKVSEVTMNYYEYVFGNLSLNGITISGLRTILFPQKEGEQCRGEKAFHSGLVSRCIGGVDLLLGKRELRQMRLYFGFKEQRLYVTAPDPIPPAAPLVQPPAELRNRLAVPN